MLPSSFFAAVRKSPFDGTLTQDQVNGLNALSEAWDTYGDDSKAKLAYVLATSFHETARTMQPITEYGGKTYFKKYDGRTDLGNNVPGDGYKFRGRGYAQVTGRRNYTAWGKRLRIDLIGNPDLALDPANAARIIIEGMIDGAFTGKKLADYFSRSVPDFRNARRIINGLDRAALIAGYATAFLAALGAWP